MAVTNPFKKNTAPPLTEQLLAKADDLDAKRAQEAASSASFAQLSSESAVASELAAKQADAVEQALSILNAAGVTA